MRRSRFNRLKEAVEVGAALEYNGRPCTVAYIDKEDGEALLKFTDGGDPKKQFVSISELEKKPAEPEKTEEPEEDSFNMSEEEKERILGAIKNTKGDELETAFNELVPSAGPAATVAGEMVRAIMRLLYRDMNDGDKFYEGYGLETCGPSAQYLIDIWKDDTIAEIFYTVAENHRYDGENPDYEGALQKVADLVIERILKGNDFVKNTEDSLNTPLTDVADMEPLYDFEVEIPYELRKHIDAGNIDTRDLQWEIESWEVVRGPRGESPDIHVGNDYITISEVPIETHDMLEDSLYDELVDYGRILDDEYGDPDEEEYEEEDDEY